MSSQPTEQQQNTQLQALADRPLMSTEQKTHDVIQQVLGSVGGQFFHNFPGNPQQQWQRIALSESSAPMKKQDLEGKAFPLTYFYVHQVVVNGKTPGELIEAVRVVLMDKDNNAVAFTSDGIAKSLARIIHTFGLGPYDPPIMIQVLEGQTRSGQRIYSIVPAQVG